MSLTGVGKETVEIVEHGSYVAPSGKTVELRAAIDRAVKGSVLYRTFEAVSASGRAPQIEVTEETTAEAARRLALAGERVVALNFASAKNPGGGFLGGAKAQEEDLARCSALYHCQLGQRAYYDSNRAEPSMLYTDHAIYSPDVPFFRNDRLELLETPFPASIITSPAPNAGEAYKRDPNAGPAIHATLERRASQVLAIAREQSHKTIVLGAWGCGVFRNDPNEVAEVFSTRLGGFDRVVFAIYDRSPGRTTLAAFRARFTT